MSALWLNRCTDNSNTFTLCTLLLLSAITMQLHFYQMHCARQIAPALPSSACPVQFIGGTGNPRAPSACPHRRGQRPAQGVVTPPLP